MNKALFFIASSKGIGLTAHLSRQIVDMYQYGLSVGWDTFCVSDEKEQYSGLWSYVENNLPEYNIIKFNGKDWSGVCQVLKSLSEKYEKSVIHCQGYDQLNRMKNLSNDHTHLVITMHSYPHKPIWRKYVGGYLFYKAISNSCDKAIFLTPFAMRGFPLTRHLMEEGKIAHIPFCLPNEMDMTRSSMSDSMRGGGYNVIYLATFLPNKGHERYFTQMQNFAKAHSDVHFWFFGDGPRLEPFRALIMEAGLQEQMHCPGRIERKFVPGLLKESQLAILLSASETFGHAFLEPIMQDCPVIGSRVGCAEYLIQDYLTSIGIDTNKSLRDALEYAYSHQEAMKKGAKKLKEIVTTLYDYNDMIAAYYNLYADIIKND